MDPAGSGAMIVPDMLRLDGFQADCIVPRGTGRPATAPPSGPPVPKTSANRTIASLHPRASVAEPVLLIPGFLLGDASMGALAAFLRSHGRPTYLSGIACNADCAEAAVRRLRGLVAELAERHKSRVALVGHSRGGLFGRVIAHRDAALVSAVITLGAPHRNPWRVNPWLVAQALALGALGSLGLPGTMTARCAAGACCSRFWRDLALPLSPAVSAFSIYSTTDRIVDWRACLEEDGRHAEVRTGHYDLPVHTSALRLVLGALNATESTTAVVAGDIGARRAA